MTRKPEYLPSHAIKCETCGQTWWEQTAAECDQKFRAHTCTTSRRKPA